MTANLRTFQATQSRQAFWFQGFCHQRCLQLSHEGQHFCQLYKTVNRGEHDEVSLLLPYPNFYLSFHTPRFDAKGERKEFDYLIKANHPVKIHGSRYSTAIAEHRIQHIPTGKRRPVRYKRRD